jgi:VanZ family protein
MVGLDKLVHILFFFIAAVLWLRALISSKKQLLLISIICIMLMFKGLAIEYLQSALTNDRSFEWYDAIADGVGVIFGIIIFFKLKYT